jgi:SCY1-like protein 1
MNYLKSITTSVLNSTGVSFPFSIGERIPGLDAASSIWEIREGVKKVGERVTATVKYRS